MLPFIDWVRFENYVTKQGLYFLGKLLTPFNAYFLRKPFSETVLVKTATTSGASISVLTFYSFWYYKISDVRVNASLELLLLRLSIC